MKLAIQPLFSGSSGNSILVESESTTVLVDAGMSAAAITKALKLHGKTPADIDGILLTHEHTAVSYTHLSGASPRMYREAFKPATKPWAAASS